MKYVQPIGAAVNAPYIDANPGLGIEGSPVPAAAIEHPQREIEAVITGAGLVAVTGDLTQLRQAIAKMIKAGQRAVIINNAVFAGAVTGTGKAVYWDSGNSRFDLALADGTAKQNCVGFADVANANVYAFGDAVLFSGLTPGKYYLNGTTAGLITVTAPTNAVFVGTAKSATEMFVDIDAVSGSVVTASSDPAFADNSARPGSTDWIRGAMLAIATAAGFAISLATNGYIKFPSWLGGLIIQWGLATTSAAGTVVTFPIAFPNACLSLIATDETSSSTVYPPGAGYVTKTTFNLYASLASSTYWFAIGY